ELAYRATGLAWTADYLAVLDEPGKLIDFSAWATIKNTTGATFDAADVTLVTGGVTATGGATQTQAARPLPVPMRYTVPHPVRIAAGDTVQVELAPPRVAAKARPVIVFEPTPDQSAAHQGYPNVDCTAGAGGGSGHSEIAVELDVPAQLALPDGRVR